MWNLIRLIIAYSNIIWRLKSAIFSSVAFDQVLMVNIWVFPLKNILDSTVYNPKIQKKVAEMCKKIKIIIYACLRIVNLW